MTTKWKILVPLLLVSAAPAAVWGNGGERPRTVVPSAVNRDGAPFDFAGIFEAKELEDQLIVLYRDPVDGSFAYTTISARTSGKDVLEARGLALEVVFDDAGSLIDLGLWEGQVWHAALTLPDDAIPERQRVMPPLDEAPLAAPCTLVEYLASLWVVDGCLVDILFCEDEEPGPGPGNPPEPFTACCDTPSTPAILDCQIFEEDVLPGGDEP